MYSQLETVMKKHAMYEGTEYDVNKTIDLHEVKHEA
jgi:hypothetical protein